MRLLGTGAGLGVAAALERTADLMADSFQRSPAGTQTLRLPRGAIIRTILKDIDPDAITGATLMHEHLGSGQRQPGAPLERPTQDVDWMVEELKAGRKVGLGCIVAAQTSIPGPDVAGYLKQLSERTGLHIVPTGAHYMNQAYPKDLATKTEDEIADGLVQAANAERFGAFGEFGVAADEADLAPEEKRVFRAVGKAHVRTGIPIFTHNNYSTGPNVPMDIALRQLDLFESVGVKPQSCAIGHVCCLDDPTADVAKKLAKRGAFVGFDRLTRQQQWVTDEKKLAMILALLDAGYADHLLLSSDFPGGTNAAVGERELRSPVFARDGGPGWARVLVWFVPMMRKAGVSEQTIRRITVDNPRRFLAFVPKQSSSAVPR
jgi:phosphotriesterase-related protein